MPNEGRGLGEYQKRQRKPVTIRGVQYESHVAAAKALGVSDRTISMAVKRGTLDNVALNKEMTNDPRMVQKVIAACSNKSHTLTGLSDMINEIGGNHE